MDRKNVKNIRIVKRLLEKPDGGWTKYGLAKAAGCSRPWVIELLGKLERSGTVQGTKVKDMMALARYGADAYPAPLKSVNCLHRDPLKLLRTAGEGYAVTTGYAENELTHHLFRTRCDAYVTQGALRKLWNRIVKEGLVGGGNMRLILPVDGEIVKEARTLRGIRIVGLGQLMIDLVREGGASVQGAEEMVRRRVWER